MNCNIHPVLYEAYLQLHKRLGAQIVHRRGRKNNMCIEIYFTNDVVTDLAGSLFTLKEAERDGYRIICRPQTKSGHTVCHGHRVYQLFLTPVHPKRRRHMHSIFLAAHASATRPKDSAAMA